MTRHALYFVPRPGALTEAAARWLGRDAADGSLRPQPDEALPALTRSAARYGFHATIVAPMRLREGAGPADLIAAMERFCATQAGVMLDGLQLASLDGFLALVPERPVAALNALAAAAVRHFTPFRAPLTEAEIARRNPAALTPRQRDLLATYGYPFVLDEFQFHMTLTDRLTPQQDATLRPLAGALVLAASPRPFAVDTLVLCAEGDDGLFHHVHRAALR